MIGKSGNCYLNFFPQNINDDTFYVGQSFLEGHYLSLSMEPYYKDPSNKLHIAIGEINPIAQIGRLRYEPDYSKYHPL